MLNLSSILAKQMHFFTSIENLDGSICPLHAGLKHHITGFLTSPSRGNYALTS